MEFSDHARQTHAEPTMKDSKPGKKRLKRWKLTLLIALGILGAVVIAVIGFFIWIMADTSPIGIYNPTYASDGRGIYYIQDYSYGIDSERFETRHRANLNAPSRKVNTLTQKAPDNVRVGLDGPISLDSPIRNDLKTQRRGNLRLEVTPNPNDATRGKSSTLSIIDGASATGRKVGAWSSGLIDSISWVNENTILVGLSMCDDGSARLERIDLATDTQKTVISVPAPGGAAASISRIATDPSGFVVFAVEKSIMDLSAPLYCYNYTTGVVRQIGKVGEYSMWDYSPQRHMVVGLSPGNPNKLIELPVTGK